MIAWLATALAATYKPADYGAVGDGNHDDGPGINAAFSAAAQDPAAVVDLRGTWWVRETVTMTGQPYLTVEAGTIRVHDDADLQVAVVVDTGRDCTIRGTLRVAGQVTSHLAGRNLGDGVHLTNANGCAIDAISVEYVRRYGARTTGGNTIGMQIGRVRCSFCGAPGTAGPPHTRVMGTAASITREGLAGSPVQRARLVSTALPVEPGDYLRIGDLPKNGGWLAEVVSVEPDGLLVYPWPGEMQGEGPWPIEGIIGGALKLTGGNTTQVVVGSVYAQYAGHGLQIASLYGCHATAVMCEVCGSGLTLGARSSALFGATIRGLHGEVTVTDVLVGGLSIHRTVLIGSVEVLTEPHNAWHVRPTLTTGARTAWTWPLTEVP